MSAFIDAHRARFGVEPICQTLDVSASAYYQRRSGRRSRRQLADERLTEQIRRVHRANYECYGYRRVHAQLVREGHKAGRDRVARLMGQAGVQGAKRRGKRWRTTIVDPAAQRPADLVCRDFSAPAPDRLWVCDFTYLRCWEGRVYFSFVIDAFSRRVVGWQLAGHMRTTLVSDALQMALATRQPGADVQLIHHSDAGAQYTSHDYQQQISDAGVLASIGLVGDAYDNALAESFVDSFKTELISDRVWRTRRDLELAVVEYVAWFNSARLHSALAYRPPDEIEASWHVEHARDHRAELADVLPPSPTQRLYDRSAVVSDIRC